MYIIVGLGNPGPDYRNTRHNMGFDTITVLANKYNISTDFVKHKAMCGKGIIDGNKVVLAMPTTYMNLSGESVRALVDFYKIDVANELIVIYDDIDLDPGALRIRKSGSAGGHNGMKNIVQHLGTNDFIRVRVGVGAKPKGYDLADYVLGHFTKDERVEIDKALEIAAESVCTIMNEGIDKAMNKYNKSAAKKKEKAVNQQDGEPANTEG